MGGTRRGGEDVRRDARGRGDGLQQRAVPPEWPGTFAGELVHSSAYRHGGPYLGRRVLVVGAGNSGAEIAIDVARAGANEVLLAVKTPPGLIRRDTLGVPSQLLGIASARLPVGMVDRIAATLRRAAFGDLSELGLPAPDRPTPSSSGAA